MELTIVNISISIFIDVKGNHRWNMLHILCYWWNVKEIKKELKWIRTIRIVTRISRAKTRERKRRAVDIDLRKPRWSSELILKTGSGVYGIHKLRRSSRRVRWVTRSFVSLDYRPIWIPGSDGGARSAARVFLRLAAHLNISLLRKAHWSASQVHFYGFCFLRVRETHIWRRALGGILIPYSQLGASLLGPCVSSPLR